MSSYQGYKQFERAITKNQLEGTRKHVFEGHISDLQRQGTISKLPPLGALKLQQTPQTVRACVACRGTRYRAVQHITGQVTLRKCGMCNGAGVRFS